MNLLLYALTVLLWGSSWIAIKYQLGVVPPDVSVVYRFLIAAATMLLICALSGRRLRFPPRDHLFMAVQGGCVFSTNYFFIYLGSQYVTSGIAAVAFSTVVVMNILGTAVLFRTPLRPTMVLGAGLGLAGITLVFWPEISSFDPSNQGARGLLLCLIGTAFASAGMLTSAWNQRRRHLPVLGTNAWGMFYGALVVTLLTLARGSSFAVDTSPIYLSSLLYLSLLATVVGFWSYLTLVGRIGADRAGYATVLFPIIALALSTWLEDFRWTAAAAGGAALVLSGNALILAAPGLAMRRSRVRTNPAREGDRIL